MISAAGDFGKEVYYQVQAVPLEATNAAENLHIYNKNANIQPP